MKQQYTTLFPLNGGRKTSYMACQHNTFDLGMLLSKDRMMDTCMLLAEMTALKQPKLEVDD